MKQLFVFLLFLFTPTMVFADLVGYGGDTRRHVTEQEKKQFPYNTVVRIANAGFVGTGTFVSEDTILTCRHVIKDMPKYGKIEYYTSDGEKHSGRTGSYTQDNDKMYDFAWIIDENAFSGRVLELSPDSKQSDNLMIVGYGNLKPLSNDELKIVKQLYANWIKDNGEITYKNVFEAMATVEIKLMTEYSCTSDNQKHCVHCSGDLGCIFNDSENMKVRTGCKITKFINNEIYTNCPVSYGDSGSAIIDMNSEQIIGILCVVKKLQIGQEKEATSLGIPPEMYYKPLKTWMDVHKEIYKIY